MPIANFKRLKRMIRECLGHFSDEFVPARAPARLSVLEPRILYSASPVDAGVDGPVETDIAHDSRFVDQFEPYPDVFLTALDSQLPVSLIEPIIAFPTEQHEPLVRELVLVNDNIENLGQLVNDLLESFKGRQFELVTISQSSDGIAQVNEILKQYSSLDSIHVFSHGSAGQINLGNAWLDAADFSARLDDLSAWGNALAAGGDLLFYGCELAGDESGRDLLRLLADATGADVAASDDLTGNSLLGGNWNLEFVVGDVLNASWLSVPQDWHWSGLLDSATFQNGLNGYAGTQDTGLDVGNPATPQGGSSQIEVTASPDMDGLIRFDNLFGSGPGQIQFGSGINSVTLTIEVVDTSLAAANIGLHRMLVTWDETSTWNSMVAGVSTDNVEASAVADGLLSSPSIMGPQTFSGAGLVATVQAWSDGQANLGWLMVNDKNNNLKFLSSESGTISLRPKLLIDYTLPNAGPINSLPGSQSTAQDTSLTLSAGNSNQISTNDPDAGSSNVEITLAVANGTVSLDLPNAVANATSPNESLSSSTTTGLQKETQIARIADGRYVVVWSGNGPGDSDGIFLRQFEADGTPIGNQIRFNGNGAKALPQSSPTVSVNEAGRIVVAWESLGQDSAGTYGIYARSMNWDGTNDTGEIAVNFNTLSNQEDPSVGIDAAGDFIVAWTDDGARDGHNEAVFARRFNASGVALDANDRQINSYTFSKQLKAEVAMMADGSHVIVWQSQNQEYGGSQFGIFGKRFDASGNPLDAPGTPGQSEFQINVTEAKDQAEPSISIDSLGRFVVVWQSKEQAGSTNGYDIYGQMFDGSGNKIGPTEFHVNTTAAFEQFNATVAMDANGDFVVAWENYTGLSGPTDIYFQQFDSLANKVGGERVANSSATGNQYLPDVGIDAAGNFIVVWDGYGTSDTDGGVFSRSYNLPSNGLTFSSGDGIYDSNMVFRGSLANVNAALDGLIFRPTAGFTGLATITITTNDLGNTGYGGSLLDTDILNIDVTSTGSPVGPISDTNAASNQVAENAANGTSVGITASATDPDAGQTVSYTLDDNAGGRFTIDSLTGIVTVANGSLLDYEAATNHNITVRATSIDGSFSTLLFGIALLPVNDNVPVFTSSNNPSVNENTTVVQTLTATDADAPLQTITYSITDGVDRGKFTINGSNQLVFVSAPDFETPLDFDFDNIYMVEVTANDGAGGLTPMMISVSVLNLVEGNILVVDTTSDVVDGITTSIGALLASPGIDGRISLREAIIATNNTLNSGGPDIIRFAIPDNDPGHYYYRNNGTAGTFSAAVTTTLNDASITDFDPDYPYTAHSWFRINLDNALPQLEVSDAVIIDGYSQPGSSVNTLTVGQNANIRIELTNTAIDTNRGLTFATGSNGSVLKGLAINRFGGLGVLVDYDVHGITIQGNFIGTDITGTVDLGNGDSGIQVRSNNNLIGGPALADRNLVSGNASRGVVLFNTSLLTGNVIQNNYIGTDSTGLKAIANDTAGVQLYNSDGTQVIDNVISGNGDGIWFRSGLGVLNINNVVTGNRIGLGANGTTIVANTGSGILVETGSANTIGGTTALAANYISGNAGNGISLTGATTLNNVISGNFIGLTTTLGAAGNLQAGVSVDLSSSNNRIGGTTAGTGNRIANNGGDGVRIRAAAGNGNSILGNSIHSNGELGIDLGANGVLANDPGDLDLGGNGSQNYPVIGSAVTNGTSLTVAGFLNSLPLATYRLEFFASPTGDPSGNGEGEIFVGFVDVTTDVAGMAAFNSVFAVAVPAGYSISATATDSSQNTSEFSANVIATIPASNLPPTDIGPNSFAIVENTNTTGGFSLGALTVTDPDVSDTFTFQIMPGSDGSKFSIGGAGLNELIITDGMIDYERQSVYSVNVRVTDSSGNSYDETLVVAVTNVDENPVANAGGPYTINEGSGVTLNGLGSTDPEGGPLTYRWDLNNDGIYGDVTGGSPAVSWATLVSRGITNQGTFTIGLETTDAGGNRNTATTTLTVNNLAPTANPNSGAGFVTNEDTAFVTGNVLANDTDPNSNDMLSVTGMNTGLTLGLVTNNGNGTFTYNPNGQFENLKPGDTAFDSFVYFMQDEFGAVSSATVTVTINGVNDEQQLVTNNLLVVLKGAAASLDSLSLRTTDLDHSAGSLVYTITSNPANGRVELVSAPGVAVTSFTQAQLDAAQLVYVHNNSNTASDSFDFSVDDGLGTVSAGTFNISVILIDQPPVANSGGPYSINEGSGVVLNGLGSADPEGGALTYRWDLNNDGVFGDVTGASPTVNWATLVSQGITNQGTFTIGLEVTDPGGQSHVSTTTLTVSNLAPTANSNSGAGFVTNEDSVFVTGNVLTNDSDPNSNDTLTVAGINTSLTRGLVTNNGNGTFSYNPNGQFENLKPGDTAFDTFVYTLRDEFGATSFATVTVTINGVNDTPFALNDSYTAILGSPLVVAGPGLLANDSDVDSAFLTMLIVSGPLGGTLTSMPNGSFTYTPVGNFVGNDSFTYMVNDGLGNSNLATVSILVAGVSPTGGSGGGGGSSGGNKDDDKDSPDPIIPGPLPEYHGLSDSTPNKADQMPGAGEKPAVQNAIRMEVTRLRSELEWTDESGEDSYWYRYWAGMKKSAELQTGDFGMLRNLEFMSQNGAFWQSLDGFLNDTVTNASLPIFVTGGSVAFTTSITAGYLVWLIRGGQILTALMANIPAWRLIDPLPILGRLPVEDDEDDDSLATMLAESSEDDYTKTFDWSDLAEAEEATSPGN